MHGEAVAMRNTNATLRDEGHGDSLKALVLELLDEPYAAAQRLSDANIESLGKLLEEAAEEMANPDLSPSVSELAPSYERCKDIYCRILMELEQRNSSLPTQTLMELAAAVPSRGGIQEIIDLTEEEENTKTDVDITRNDLKKKDPPKKEDIAGAFRSILRPPPPLVEELTGPSEGETEVESTGGSEPAVERKLRLAPKPPVPETPAHFPTSGRAHEYVTLAKYLSSLKTDGNFPLPAGYADRLASHSFCFAVEAMCIDRLTAPLGRMWPKRNELIPPVLSQEADKPGLVAALKRALDELAQIHGAWLPDKRFPHHAATHALRYMHSYERSEAFHPALIDSGTLILLFGQQRNFGKVALQNALGLKGLSNSETIELSFRLMGLQKLRNRALSIGGEPADGIGSLLSKIETEAGAVFKLLGKMESEGK
jgi:hypothetical protein